MSPSQEGLALSPGEGRAGGRGGARAAAGWALYSPTLPSSGHRKAEAPLPLMGGLSGGP